MSALAITAPHWFEETCDGISNWLDDIFAGQHTHRQLERIAQYVDMLDNELYELDSSLGDNPTPSQLVSMHALSLRVNDMRSIIDAKWRSPKAVHTSQRALHGIHERYIGRVPTQGPDVLFEVSRNMPNVDFDGYIEAHRIEYEGRWCSHQTQARPYGYSMTVISAPRWVHNMYSLLAGEHPRGAALRSKYLPENWPRANEMVVGRAVQRPDSDTVMAALTLWEPETAGSTYCRFENALHAARLL